MRVPPCVLMPLPMQARKTPRRKQQRVAQHPLYPPVTGGSPRRESVAVAFQVQVTDQLDYRG